VRRHCEAENRHDVEAMLATFSPSRASYDVPAFGEAGQPTDAASVRAMWEERADWLGIPAAGRSFVIRAAAIYEFEGDQLVCERAYTDLADWMRQLQ